MTLSTVFQKIAAKSLEIVTFFVLGLNRVTCWKVKMGVLRVILGILRDMWCFMGVFAEDVVQLVDFSCLCWFWLGFSFFRLLRFIIVECWKFITLYSLQVSPAGETLQLKENQTFNTNTRKQACPKHNKTDTNTSRKSR